MNSIALGLVVSGALLHALWNVLAKKAAGGVAFVWLFGVISLAIAIPCGLLSWMSYAQGLSLHGWIAIVASAMVHVVYSLVLQKGYQEADFSVVYPLARGTAPLFAVLGAVVLLNESPSLLGWLGIVGVLVGVFLVSGGWRALGASSAEIRAAFTWGVLTGLSIAAYTLIDGWAVKVLGMPPVLYYALGLGIRTSILAPRALQRRHDLSSQWRKNASLIVAVGILSPVAYMLVLFAMTISPLSYVAPVRELSMLIGVLFGAKLLSESIAPSRLLGTACIVAGVIALSRA